MRVETLDGIHTQKTSMMLKMASKTLMTQVLKIIMIIIWRAKLKQSYKILIILFECMLWVMDSDISMAFL